MLAKRGMGEQMELGFAAALVLLALYVPFAHFVIPAASALHLSIFGINLIGQIMCFALLALALDLVWGYAGILSLGHGIFFGIGAYLMGIYLLDAAWRDTHVLPDFMQYMGWSAFPTVWGLFSGLGATIVLTVLVAAAVAGVFGFVTFRSRINGVYLSIITQALTYALMLLLFINDVGLGGNNGLTGFTSIAGHRLADVPTQVALAVASCLLLVGAYLALRALTRSSLGRALIAVRDDEPRMRFLGYRTHVLKLLAWCLSAVLAALAGMLYVPQVGIVNPTIVSPELSVEIAVWVAIGGRGTLIGAIVGAILVNGLKFWLSARLPSVWPFILAAVTLAITVYLGGGLWGAVRPGLQRGK
ncbi:urea ABC transporter permease subunit UrtC [Burkholderia sp. WAC0059]|uniref:urea ABC transporter permease subunit UrtC n=1 Tax=Burkholderia sp. WAC0059 TaxID=2066022 RepID=UPI000C7F352E|nr:urea ABC transporter permease subunit UrtC [Burkholderia sp. WAC0059]PLZ03045.1 urea ABC transporter permease subunit UrtC [Burkholderia sp. WAC0059]